MAEFMKTKKVGKAPFVFSGNVVQMTPTELLMKDNGSIAEDGSDREAFCVVLTHPELDTKVIGQLSLKTLTDALDELGFQVLKKDSKW